MIFIVGGKGFVGSAIVRYCEKENLEHRIIQKNNYSNYIGKHCDIFINANGNSKKYLAKQNDGVDFDLSVNSVHQTLVDFSYNKYVFLSSADVYPDTSNKNSTLETTKIDVSLLKVYGFNKYLAELIVKNKAEKWLIFRLTGMVGYGLKKNPIYDILFGEKLWIDPSSKFQYINTDDVASIIMRFINKNQLNQEYNVAGKGVVVIKDIVSILNKKINVHPNSEIITHEVNTEKIEQLIDLPSSVDTINSFINNLKHKY